MGCISFLCRKGLIRLLLIHLLLRLDSSIDLLIVRFFLLWHKRLDHPSTSVVKTVLNNCHIKLNNVSSDNVCTACKKEKIYKLPFSNSTTEYTGPFALVVSDVWGPASVACTNNWFYVTFIDMCTRFT